MNKISLKINNNNLLELISSLQENRNIVEHISIEDKANNFLLLDVLKKLKITQINKIGVKPKKEFTISLKYQEAAVLWSTIGSSIITNNEYRKNVVLQISNKLHNKLMM